METEALVKQVKATNKELEEEYSDWKTVQEEAVKFLKLNIGRFGGREKHNKPQMRSNKIIDNEAKKAVNTLVAGMQSGLTNPLTEWFKYTIADKELMESSSVKRYLYDCERIIYAILNASNFYKTTPKMYKEVSCLGVCATLVLSDYKDVVRFYPLTAGEFYVANNARGEIDLIHRNFFMSGKQLEEEYGLENLPEQIKEDVKGGYSKKRYEVIHEIGPNKHRDISKVDAANKPYISIHILKDVDDKQALLRVSGFDDFPASVALWDGISNEAYSDCPGFDAISDCKMIQGINIDKLDAIKKNVKPPVTAPLSTKDRGGVNMIPGGVTYTDPIKDGNASVKPTLAVSPMIQDAQFVINDTRDALRSNFFYDLFRMISDPTKQMTAHEVAERSSEKMTVLGPVITNLLEFLRSMLNRIHNLADEARILPEPPSEIIGVEIEIEFVSILAQAQKMVGTNAINNVISFVGSVAQFSPEVLDKFNADEAIDAYSDMVGVPPKLIRSDAEVEEIRAARRAQEQQVQQNEMARQALEGAKTLSETNTGENSALSQILGGAV
jgi:hypothetical protein